MKFDLEDIGWKDYSEKASIDWRNWSMEKRFNEQQQNNEPWRCFALKWKKCEEIFTRQRTKVSLLQREIWGEWNKQLNRSFSLRSFLLDLEKRNIQVHRRSDWTAFWRFSRRLKKLQVGKKRIFSHHSQPGRSHLENDVIRQKKVEKSAFSSFSFWISFYILIIQTFCSVICSQWHRK